MIVRASAKRGFRVSVSEWESWERAGDLICLHWTALNWYSQLITLKSVKLRCYDLVSLSTWLHLQRTCLLFTFPPFSYVSQLFTTAGWRPFQAVSTLSSWPYYPPQLFFLFLPVSISHQQLWGVLSGDKVAAAVALENAKPYDRVSECVLVCVSRRELSRADLFFGRKQKRRKSRTTRRIREGSVEVRLNDHVALTHHWLAAYSLCPVSSSLAAAGDIFTFAFIVSSSNGVDSLSLSFSLIYLFAHCLSFFCFLCLAPALVKSCCWLLVADWFFDCWKWKWEGEW